MIRLPLNPTVRLSSVSMVLKVGSGDIDDLSTLNVLDEESLLRELRARYKKGIIYVGHSLALTGLYPLVQ